MFYTNWFASKDKQEATRDLFLSQLEYEAIALYAMQLESESKKATCCTLVQLISKLIRRGEK